MSIQVWHLDHSAIASGVQSSSSLPAGYYDAIVGFKDDGAQERACADLFAQGGYKLVASIVTAELETAWELSNSIDSSWTLNSGVEAAPGQHRSSSVGDLFEKADGSFHVASSIGFRPVPGLPGAAADPKKAAKP